MDNTEIDNQQSSQVMLRAEEEKKVEIEQASYFELFRFATKYDAVLMVIGTICACAMGTALPSFALLWGNMTNSFGDSNMMV
jgi:ATP-binding cassette subfamily B (MDR/TAP) protein 1